MVKAKESFWGIILFILGLSLLITSFMSGSITIFAIGIIIYTLGCRMIDAKKGGKDV